MPKKGKAGTRRAVKHAVKSTVLAILAMAFSVCVGVAGVIVMWAVPDQPREPPRAAIVDSLWVMDANPGFLSRSEELLEAAGLAVDLYVGSNVTVDLFRRLPIIGYKLIVFRVHSAWEVADTEATAANPTSTAAVDAPPKPVVFFTGERFQGGIHVSELVAGEVACGAVYDGARWLEFFAVSPLAIAGSRERFAGTVVVVDSCYGLNSTAMADAFVRKGASVYVAWDGGVTSAYSDEATERLLLYLFREGLSVDAAVRRTMNDVGPDPYYGGLLSYYPPERGYLKMREEPSVSGSAR